MSAAGEKRSPGMALVAVLHGTLVLLAFDGDEGVQRWVEDQGRQAGDAVDHALPDGVWVAELRLVDDGPGDWPGSREVALRADRHRAPTAGEWRAFALLGEPPWEPYDDEHAAELGAEARTAEEIFVDEILNPGKRRRKT